MKAWMVACAIAVLGAACGGVGASLPAGASCASSDACAGGLTCLDVAQVNGATCTVVGKSCSKVCTGDGDCATLGASFKCFAGCGTDKTCEATAAP